MVDTVIRVEADIMDATTAVGAARFTFTKPPLGRAKGAVTVEASTVRIEHPLLKNLVEIPFANLILVHLASTTDAVPVLRRDSKLVRLGVTPYTEANLALVFRQPVPFGRSRWGTRQLTGIKGRDRRRGPSVDAVALSLAEPEAAIAEMRARRVTEAPTLPDALVGVIGVPEGPELEEREQSIAKARTRAYRMLVGSGLFTAVSLPLRFAVDSGLPASRLLHIGGAALAGAAFSGIVTINITRPRQEAPGPVARRPKPSPSKRMVFTLLAALGTLGAFAGGLAWAAALSGAGQTLALGAVLGLPGGVVLGMVYRSAIAFRAASDPVALLGISSAFRPLSPPVPHPLSTGWLAATSSAPPLDPLWPGGPVEPVGATPKRRWRRRLGIGLMLVVGAFAGLFVLGLIIEAAASPPDSGLAGRATITAAELPVGWAAYRGAGPDTPDTMDDHICGNQPNALPDHTGGYDRQFGYQVDHGAELAHLDVGVLISPNAAAAQQEFAVALDNGPAYRSCVTTRAVQLSESGSAEATGDPVTSISRSTIDGIPGIVDQIIVTTPTVRGQRVTVITFVRLRIDRVIVRMPITTWGRPISDPELLPIIRAEQRKVEAALAAET